MSILRLAAATPLVILLVPSPCPAEGQSARAATTCDRRGGNPSPTMFATLLPATDSAGVPGMYLAILLQEALSRFHPPDTVENVTTGVVAMWLHADGRVSNVRAVDPLPASLGSALTNAIDSLMRRGGVGPVIPAMVSDSAEVHLVLHWSAERTKLSIPLFRRSPPPFYSETQVDKPALAKSGGPFPNYPRNLLEANFEGEVLLEVVVDETGRPDMPSVRVLKSSHADFTEAVREVLPRIRFSPAELESCAVKQLVQIPFAFKVRR